MQHNVHIPAMLPATNGPVIAPTGPTSRRMAQPSLPERMALLAMQDIQLGHMSDARLFCLLCTAFAA